MTSKKKRQRGSRTHGGGTHKNRRGAGNRGGRGAAGRDKHEFHNYEPLGKSGFTRPEKATETVETIDVRELDEDVALLAADGLAEEDGGTYRIDVREVVDTSEDVDAVKVLGAGQVRNELELVADGFSAGAVEKVEAAGGSVELTELGEERQSEDDTDDDNE
jgi:large subunit ribosomal protein L15